MKLARKHSKIDKSPPLSVEMAAIHTTSSHDKEILQKSSFEELGYSTGHKYLTSDVKLHKNKDTHVCAFASFPASKIFLSSVAVEQCVQKCPF